MDDDVRRTMPLPRKRGPRGPRSRVTKQMRQNSQGQNLQGTQSQLLDSWLGKEVNQVEGVADQGQQSQVKKTQHLIQDSILRHLLEQDGKEDEEEEASTMHSPRRRGPRGPGSRGGKKPGKGLQEQDSCLGKTSNQLEGEADLGEDLQVEENQHQGRGKGNSIKLESMMGQAALPRRKRLYVPGIEQKHHILYSGPSVKGGTVEETLTQWLLSSF